MGQAERTTKLQLDLGKRDQGGANREKHHYLETTRAVLDEARAFYLAFFLAHPAKLTEKVQVISKKTGEVREAVISADKLLTWAEYQTVATREHPMPHPDWNFSARFPDLPWEYRRSVIKDCIGKARAYLSATTPWQASGKKKGKPGMPTPRNHPTLYEGTFSLTLEGGDLRRSFVRLRVYTGQRWMWVNYPTRYSRYFEERRTEPGWQALSPKLVLTKTGAAIHFPQTKPIEAKRVVERKRDPDLVTVAVDLNVKNLAVITVRQHDTILESRFLTDHGLDQHRYRHLRRIAKKQWQSGKPVKGERSNQQLWRHVKHMNESAAHKVARQIAEVCVRYPGCVLLFERLRKIKPSGGSKSRRMNRRQANQLRGKINQYAKDKAYEQGIVTVEVNPWGSSQHCSRCGAKGERFSASAGKRVRWKGGKLFWCPVWHYLANADHNGSANLHHSFFAEFCWQPKAKRKPPG
ncbi:MAG TPA: transposase [Ktedonobacteraceae bacterium]